MPVRPFYRPFYGLLLESNFFENVATHVFSGCTFIRHLRARHAFMMWIWRLIFSGLKIDSAFLASKHGAEKKCFSILRILRPVILAFGKVQKNFHYYHFLVLNFARCNLSLFSGEFRLIFHIHDGHFYANSRLTIILLLTSRFLHLKDAY